MGFSFFSWIRWPSQLSHLLLIVVLHGSDPVFLPDVSKREQNDKISDLLELIGIFVDLHLNAHTLHFKIVF